LNCDVGVIGLAVMGQNLALNIHNNGFKVAVYNRTALVTDEFIKRCAENAGIIPAYTLEELAKALAPPRKIILMVKAGPPVDLVITGLLPLLEAGDIIIDGGNSHFTDTDRRVAELKSKGIFFLGTGISGGEYGALHGPSIMTGGSMTAYQQVEPILTSIAAKTEDGSCCTYLGSSSAGHYVKMVHNGIEYAIMQIIAETYDILRQGLKLPNAQIQGIFSGWNDAELNSYLMEITQDILKRTDEKTGVPLVEMILDKAEQKGTGKWTSQSALDFGIPVPTITAAVDGRILSAYKEQREQAAKVLTPPGGRQSDNLSIEQLRSAVYLAVLTSYAQGFHLLQAASQEKGYELNLREVARIWKGGCIIRAKLLDPIQKVYKEDPGLFNLLLSPVFSSEVNKRVSDLAEVICQSAACGLPTPALSASLNYIASLRAENLPSNLIQAQRDYFGAHTYQRVDQEGSFHTDWLNIKKA
jgi:6-phosphogluconate dehydrogenase